ncbi:MAG: acyl carrier protein [Planctomycetota bacterium]
MSDATPRPPAASITGSRVRAAIAQVLADIAPEADLAAVAPDANLRRELDLDSVDFQNLLAGLSKTLGRDIPDRDAGGLVSITACEAFFR